MAISKTQPMRSAEIEILDTVNDHTATLGIHQQSLNALAEGLADEISSREQADTTLGDAIEAEALTRRDADIAIQNQIGDGFADTTVTSVTNALSSAVQSISDEIGSGFSAQETIADAIGELEAAMGVVSAWQSRFRLGLTDSVTIEAGGSQSDTLSFNTAFADDAEVAVFLVCVDGAEILTNLDCTLISATYSGFSWSVANGGEDDVSVKVGFLAVRMN